MRIEFFCAAAVFLMFISVNGFAQDTKPEIPPSPPPQNDDKNNNAPLSAEESAYMTADALKWELKLSDEQYRQVYNVTLSELKKKEKLWDAGNENVISKEEMTERLQKIDEGIDAQMKDILTPEQFEKYISKRNRPQTIRDKVKQ